ncbi:hypothetical protein ICG_01826 [Bacillus cereus BAG1X1-3]|nr:hypothetical protein bcere0029_35040 [Bacillus cereus AH1272]EEL92444.1 hypothetical protein bcere0030_34720 [Bacillus cereus AH1273]EJS58620.1 hypothetical protein ICG_01826 [Bacillus cereus BAG1X1-3]EOO72847.1 hypothetical protein IC7_03074 [Bacillus cereus BAG1O-1]EOP51736.1 hypothetical protein IKQ_03297 [Bacillus cereus VDM053]OSX99882.1 hypothetical protein BTJ45_02506 [Bacillus mycoides]SEA48859.1 hypothetical protein SAMN04488146_102801 [Bacillus nitratireducens]
MMEGVLHHGTDIVGKYKNVEIINFYVFICSYVKLSVE